MTLCSPIYAQNWIDISVNLCRKTGYRTRLEEKTMERSLLQTIHDLISANYIEQT